MYRLDQFSMVVLLFFMYRLAQYCFTNCVSCTGWFKNVVVQTVVHVQVGLALLYKIRHMQSYVYHCCIDYYLCTGLLSIVVQKVLNVKVYSCKCKDWVFIVQDVAYLQFCLHCLKKCCLMNIVHVQVGFELLHKMQFMYRLV